MILVLTVLHLWW